MPRVAALYRYPLKGFTPEPCEALSVLRSGQVAGDRVLGIRFADTEAPDNAWSRKTGMLALVNTPGLACLRVRFDAATLRLRIDLNDATLIDAPLDEQGRRRIADAVADYVITLNENPLTDHPERLPLRVVGDGVTPRYHDSEAGEVTLHGRGSLAALARALSVAEISELRFRSNVAVDGLEAWEEQSWVGRKLRVGSVLFEAGKPKLRCLATHANPETGKRDLAVLETLTSAFGQEMPIFAIAMALGSAPSVITVGDQVELRD